MQARPWRASGLCLLAAALVPSIGAAQSITEIIDATGDGVHPFSGGSFMAVDACGNAFVTGGFALTPTRSRS